MTRIQLKNKRMLFQATIYALMLVLGVLFIINNAFLLKLAFYAVGGVIIICSVYMLVNFLKRQRVINASAGRQTPYPILGNPVLTVFFAVMVFCSGLTVILNAGMGIDFYQGVLSSLFFFRSIQRFFSAYVNHKMGMKQRSAILTVLASVGLILAAFFSFYEGKDWVVGLVSGIAVILEGIYGIYNTLIRSILRKKIKEEYRNQFFSTNPNYNTNNFNSYFDQNSAYGGNYGNADYNNTSFSNTTNETIITDYEIVDDNQNKK